jgi:hypothetical protein
MGYQGYWGHHHYYPVRYIYPSYGWGHHHGYHHWW